MHCDNRAKRIPGACPAKLARQRRNPQQVFRELIKGNGYFRDEMEQQLNERAILSCFLGYLSYIEHTCRGMLVLLDRLPQQSCQHQECAT